MTYYIVEYLFRAKPTPVIMHIKCSTLEEANAVLEDRKENSSCITPKIIIKELI